MKKLLVFVVVIFLAYLNLSAQIVGNAPYRINSSKGFKFGLNSANLDFSYTTTWARSPLSGFFLSAFYAVEFNKYIAFQPEICVSQKGTTWKSSDTNATSKWRLYYMEIPLLVKFTYPLNGGICPGAYIGPYGALLIGATEIYKENSNPEETTNIYTDMNFFDYGLVIGGTLEYRFTAPFRGRIIFDVRYSWGFANADKSIEDTLPGEKAKNRVLTFMIGFGF